MHGEAPVNTFPQTGGWRGGWFSDWWGVLQAHPDEVTPACQADESAIRCEISVKEMFTFIHPSSSGPPRPTHTHSLTPPHVHTHPHGHTASGEKVSGPHLVDIFIGTRSNLCKVSFSQSTGPEHSKSKQREKENKLLF